ncbi:glycoside hydrolase family 2 TIM barrel-domain containing protein [Rhodopirellula sp. MGV]|uniref:glycoside hydrolase family 2 TIM barrel-domain containing protein n=1 Tax=Rhodopirellula sp. MGV TaxID=2023130 RepID=UPI000B96D442|nr:glycoside hydrolase family 2 TIM barrel-domain containing protein [Rhodopirellula sp. MGV]OYP36012.1 hypothetical protein CGZ80_09660 [Rhodopirellula sp. MGV]PNY36629.1 hypothetical protein C2E31_12340 [Rhodopirellula baltica]
MTFTRKLTVIFLNVFVLFAVGVSNVNAQAIPVHVLRESNGFQLVRDGKPYPIHGVGGNEKLELLAELGGNSIRTWSTDGLGELLDQAHQQGLTVCVGMWLGHPRHGFDYQDEAAVLKQLNDCLQTVRRYKDHPAVLIWAIGNEMEGDGKNPAIWYAVEHIAREIKAIDTHHPTMTVIAELGEAENKLRRLGQFCPHVDIVGVNSYAGISTLAERYRNAGVDKPYIVTEHGPHGPWEVAKTRWGTPIESTSTLKGNRYRNGYESTAIQSKDLCFGSYAFLWGNKQETTATWFGMMLPDGSRLEAADAMSTLWKGMPPANRCPQLTSISIDQADRLKPGQLVKASVDVSDPEGDSIEVTWVLRQDSGTIGVGGDFQQAELAFKEAVNANGKQASITIPSGGGNYRLFAYVKDQHGGAAVANVPLFVDAPQQAIPAAKATLPFVVYADSSQPPYEPSGYMGNTQAIEMQFDCTAKPYSGKTCVEVQYQASDKWGGVLWQSPANDWEGNLPGGLDLSGATALEFYARGAEGGEVVSVVIGVIESDTPYADSSKAELKDVRLTPEWNRYQIPLKGMDLSRIKTGFGWSLAGQGKPIKFYLDDIRYISE